MITSNVTMVLETGWFAFLDAFSAWLALYSWPSYLPWLP